MNDLITTTEGAAMHLSPAFLALVFALTAVMGPQPALESPSGSTSAEGQCTALVDTNSTGQVTNWDCIKPCDEHCGSWFITTEWGPAADCGCLENPNSCCDMVLVPPGGKDTYPNGDCGTPECSPGADLCSGLSSYIRVDGVLIGATTTAVCL